MLKIKTQTRIHWNSHKIKWIEILYSRKDFSLKIKHNLKTLRPNKSKTICLEMILFGIQIQYKYIWIVVKFIDKNLNQIFGTEVFLLFAIREVDSYDYFKLRKNLSSSIK